MNEFNRNEESLKKSLFERQQRLQKIHEGGGSKAIEKQKQRNKLVARERIEWLLISVLSAKNLKFEYGSIKN
jgi:3-methylcrotonyl-CoA carboxylase beta subunit